MQKQMCTVERNEIILVDLFTLCYVTTLAIGLITDCFITDMGKFRGNK